MEIFYDLALLDAATLRELYLEARALGDAFVEYDNPDDLEEHLTRDFPLESMLENIRPREDNSFAFVSRLADLPDFITIGLPLPAFPFMTAYVELDTSLLVDFVKKYSLKLHTGSVTALLKKVRAMRTKK